MRASSKINALWAQYMATYLTEEEKVLAADFQDRRAVFLRDGLEPALAIAAQGDGARLQEHHDAKAAAAVRGHASAPTGNWRLFRSVSRARNMPAPGTS